MFSIVIATRDSERTLVPTLAALVPGATAGIVREVIVADANSKDETEQIADIAGCRFLTSTEAKGARLKAAAGQARGDWLMFLEAGVVPAPTWIEEATAFANTTTADVRAAVFAPAPSFAAAWRRLFLSPVPQQGLILRKSVYVDLGGHRAEASKPEIDLARRIGPRRIITLRAGISIPVI